jgi:hypothetical protein
MGLQWVGGIVAAYLISPRAWIGITSQTHLHVWAAIFLGGAISALPIILAITQPGKLTTRHTIGVAQMLMGALLIHITGGRIETHFHVFGSLAFLSFYRDWRVLCTCDHRSCSLSFFTQYALAAVSLGGSLRANGAGWNTGLGFVRF